MAGNSWADALTIEIVRARARYHRWCGWYPANAWKEANVEQMSEIKGGRTLMFPGRKVFTTMTEKGHSPLDFDGLRKKHDDALGP